MKRNIIGIDENKCTGCGDCIPDCPEGALQMIDGKARLVSDLFCDGLGACISTCPFDAIEIEEREAEPYNERKVMENIIPQGANVIAAHLSHLKGHGETGYLNEAINYLKEKNIPVPKHDKEGHGCSHNHEHGHKHEHAQVNAHAHAHAGHAHGTGMGCPGAMARDMRKQEPSAENHTPTSNIKSELRQWPVQLKLLNPGASYFDNADILLAADCVPFAYANFHSKFLKDKIVIMFCPKLDPYIDEYVDKLAAIVSQHEIKSITVAHMEVPCCGGVSMILRKALEKAGKNVFVKEYTISIDGEII